MSARRARARTLTDGITSITVPAPLDLDVAVKVNLDALRAFCRAHPLGAVFRRAGDATAQFDAAVAELETWCQARRRGGRSRYGSPAWYAGKILPLIADVRTWLAAIRGRGDAANARAAGVDVVALASARIVMGALALGQFATEAHAKHAWPVVRIGRARQRQVQTWSARGAVVRKAAALPTAPLLAAVATVRRARPAATVSAIARVVRQRALLAATPEAVERILGSHVIPSEGALRKRIARLPRK
ncbi:MAG: hypothetical protein AB7H93_16485 [Vicinamibacterales bacterium]